MEIDAQTIKEALLEAAKKREKLVAEPKISVGTKWVSLYDTGYDRVFVTIRVQIPKQGLESLEITDGRNNHLGEITLDTTKEKVIEILSNAIMSWAFSEVW